MYMVTQEGQNGEEDFAAMLAESFGQDSVKEGEILRGTVIAVGKDYAIVDVGYKSEGQVPLEEFRSADGSIGVKPGDVVDVLLESRENDAGMCVLSKEKADRFKVWDEISAACERDELIEGIITHAREGRPLGHHPRRREGVPARARRSTCARSATSTRSSARASSSRSSSSTRSAATSCCRAACSSRRSAPRSRSRRSSA